MKTLTLVLILLSSTFAYAQRQAIGVSQPGTIVGASSSASYQCCAKSACSGTTAGCSAIITTQPACPAGSNPVANIKNCLAYMPGYNSSLPIPTAGLNQWFTTPCPTSVCCVQCCVKHEPNGNCQIKFTAAGASCPGAPGAGDPWVPQANPSACLTAIGATSCNLTHAQLTGATVFSPCVGGL